MIPVDIKDLANQVLPDDLRQEVLNGAFWLAADMVRAQPSTREVLVTRINRLVDSFLEMGFTPDELREAASTRVRR